MIWSDPLCLQLIKEYEKHRILWAPEYSNHRNKEAKEESWNSIAQSLGTPVEDARKKMEWLRRKFKQIIENETASGNQTNGSQWFAYEAMSFLRPGFRSQGFDPKTHSIEGSDGFRKNQMVSFGGTLQSSFDMTPNYDTSFEEEKTAETEGKWEDKSANPENTVVTHGRQSLKDDKPTNATSNHVDDDVIEGLPSPLPLEVKIEVLPFTAQNMPPKPILQDDGIHETTQNLLVNHRNVTKTYDKLETAVSAQKPTIPYKSPIPAQCVNNKSTCAQTLSQLQPSPMQGSAENGQMPMHTGEPPYVPKNTVSAPDTTTPDECSEFAQLVFQKLSRYDNKKRRYVKHQFEKILSAVDAGEFDYLFHLNDRSTSDYSSDSERPHTSTQVYPDSNTTPSNTIKGAWKGLEPAPETEVIDLADE